jgi:UDP-GlcNAc:undecaprenyl-phosphate/decaprenyl-phosphate GlcNAc-1-phosphate transferase
MYTGSQLFLILAGLFFAALAFSLLVNSVFMRFARTLGLRETKVQPTRWSNASKPAFGGIGFFIVFLGAFSFYSALFPGRGGTLQPELLGLLAATALGFLMGLADDAYNTRPLLKFSVQVACGVILIAAGACIQVFDTQWANWLLTILWTVGMMNSINMLDNMDAITTTVSIFIVASAIMVLHFQNQQESVRMVICVGVLASLCGFLFFNWNPSRMFMGDTGSQFLGVFLAWIGVECFWNAEPQPGQHDALRQAFAALIGFLLPLVDTTIVTINRIARGSSPFVGGKDHTTHHLGYAGLSDAQVAMAFAGLSAVNLLLGFIALRFIDIWQPIHSAIFGAYAITVFLTLFILTRRTKPPVE